MHRRRCSDRSSAWYQLVASLGLVGVGAGVLREQAPSRPSTRYLLAPVGHPPLVEIGADVRRRDPEVRLALWELPALRSDAAVGRDIPSPG